VRLLLADTVLRGVGPGRWVVSRPRLERRRAFNRGTTHGWGTQTRTSPSWPVV